MYLKRLDLYGFKSFADRTELEFTPGISAVVGPNGSGKSNIADAIRWVLGEQSAKSLRGLKMEDIIFAGSDSRKGVNFAEVSITLDNSSHQLPLDYSEVTVTRRLYRTGESEFMINKSPCRLKDIVELFMDTGLGREAYSIIGQGRIDEILSTKAEDRRGVFEEASGIVKYKMRKKEAEKKLSETENVLLRVSDILQEIEVQLNPLTEQAAKARKYKELKERLKGKEIGLTLYSIEHTYFNWNESKKKITELTEKEGIAAGQLSARDAELEAKRWQLTQLEQEIDQIHARLIETVERVEKLDGERKLIEERIKNASISKESLQSELKRLQLQRQEILTRKESFARQKESLLQEKKELEEALYQLEERIKRIEAVTPESIEHLKNEYIGTLSRLAAMRNEEKNLTQQRDQLTYRKERVFSEIEKAEQEQRDLKEKASSLQALGKKHEETLLSLKEELKEKNERYPQWKERREALSRRLRTLEQEEHQLTSRLDTLKELQADFAGFNQGVKEILKAKKKGFAGIVGAVLELIRVPKELETAIEITLGPALQHVVVQDEEAGRAAISYLKKHQLGRATFLPLSVMKSRRITPEEERLLHDDAGIVGIAADLIQYEPRYRSIMENLLGNVVIVKDLLKANEIARRLNYRYRIVTLEGEVVNPGGSMTGGSLKQKGHSLLGRERAVEETVTRLQQVTAQKEKAQEEAISLSREGEILQEEIGRIQQDMEAVAQKISENNTELTKIGAELKNAETALLYRKEEIDQLTDEIEAITHRLAQLKEKYNALAREEERLKQAIEDEEQAKLQKESSKGELSEEVTRLKVSLAKKEQEITSHLENERRVEGELAHIEEEIVRKEREKEGLLEAELRYREEERKLSEEWERLRLQREELQRDQEDKKKRRLELTALLDGMEKEVRELRRTVKNIQDALHQEEVRENRYEVELDNLLEKLREEYDLTYEAAKEEYMLPEEEKIPLIRQEAAALKREIAALGEVNLGSIEEYERLSERKAFFTTQSDDLKKAKERLYEVIREMEEEMKKRFEDTFSLIQIEFRQVFSQLFGGGRADLILTEPENPLETGVEIMAQPPGKKLQNLSLLSGGERALTAIALLFAILRVRPVPFCILDEVDAALDATNVSRFARYLKDFSEETQFIVITHRKGTMEEANVLYGVTMEGSGVSKIVSVRLEEVAS